jgi:hypothetical protein
MAVGFARQRAANELSTAGGVATRLRSMGGPLSFECWMEQVDLLMPGQLNDLVAEQRVRKVENDGNALDRL